MGFRARDMWHIRITQILWFLLLSFAFSGCDPDPSVEIVSPVPYLLFNDSDVIEIRVNSDLASSIIITGKITPPDATLSIAYEGECGKSYYSDMETVKGAFIHNVPISFIHGIDLLIYARNGAVTFKTIHLKNSGHKTHKQEDECDYLKVREEGENRPYTYIVEESCYKIGYKYGSCVSRAHLNMACKPGTDISIPFRCRERADTEAGIKAGRI